VCPYFELARRGKVTMAPIPRGDPSEAGAPRYHDELIHGWAPPERR